MIALPSFRNKQSKINVQIDTKVFVNVKIIELLIAFVCRVDWSVDVHVTGNAYNSLDKFVHTRWRHTH